MGLVTRSAYELGQTLAVAAFNLSIQNPTGAAQSVRTGLNPAAVLTAAHSGLGGLQNTLAGWDQGVPYDQLDVEDLRAKYFLLLAPQNSETAFAYQFGTLIGGAEGQTVSPAWPGLAKRLAVSDIFQAVLCLGMLPDFIDALDPRSLNNLGVLIQGDQISAPEANAQLNTLSTRAAAVFGSGSSE